MNSNILTKLSFWSLFLVVTLLPIFFLPFTNIPIETGKGLFLVIGLIISVIFWIIVRFSDGHITLPKSLPLVAGLGVVVVTLLSAIFSGALDASFFGTMLDVGTFWFMLAAFLLMLMAALIFKDPKNARMVLFGTIASALVVMVFQALHLFLPKVLALGVLVNKTDNILGSWNSFGIFTGFFVVAALFLLELFPIEKTLKIILGVFVVVALALITLVNFVFAWEILGIFALLIFIYKVSINSAKGKEAMKNNFPLFSFGVVLVSLFFFMSAGLIGGILPTRLGLVNNEISPSLMSTFSVTKDVVKDHPVLGIGPNRFTEAWAMYKPVLINQTQFWDVSFNSGAGLLPTLTATTGLLGILAWIVFLVLFVITGIKWLFFSLKNNISLETVSFFFLSLYLFIASFFYFTGSVIFLLAFVFAGVFIGLVSSNTKEGELSVSFLNDHRKSFISMLVLVILMILSAAVGFKYIQRFISVPYFTKTLSAANVADAETYINKALVLNTNDLYLRTYAQVYLLKMNSIVSAGATDISDADKATLQTSLDQAVSGAQLATTYNNKNYLNYQMLGNVFQTAGIIGVKDGYSKALEAYESASKLNPNNPRLKLVMANVSISLGKNSDAKDYANQALTLKPDYIDALITLSQIAKNEGDTAGAVSYAQKALSFAPGNKDLMKYVDSLRGTSTNTSETKDTTKKQ